MQVEKVIPGRFSSFAGGEIRKWWRVLSEAISAVSAVEGQRGPRSYARAAQPKAKQGHVRNDEACLFSRVPRGRQQSVHSAQRALAPIAHQSAPSSAPIEAFFPAKPTGFCSTSQPNALRFPMEFKSFSNGIQIVFQWNSDRFPMEVKTFSNGNRSETHWILRSIPA